MRTGRILACCSLSVALSVRMLKWAPIDPGKLATLALIYGFWDMLFKFFKVEVCFIRSCKQ